MVQQKRKEDLKRINEMVAGIVRPSDFTGVIVNPIEDLGKCTMADLASMVISYESFILPDSFTPEEMRCWGFLRNAVDHYTNPAASGALPEAEFMEAAAQAHRDLIEYACEAEELFGHKVCTYNLHRIICVGFRQELMRGPMCKDGELWVERIVQWIKRLIHGRTGSAPTITIAKDTMSLM